MARQGEVEERLGIKSLKTVKANVSEETLSILHDYCQATGYPVATVARDCFLAGLALKVEERKEILIWREMESDLTSNPTSGDDP